MPLTQKETQSHLKKFYRFLSTDITFEFKQLRGCRGKIYGYDDHQDVTIEIDHRFEIIPTLLHEFLHYQYPDVSETNILKLEKKLINSLSDRQVRTIVKKWANKL